MPRCHTCGYPGPDARSAQTESWGTPPSQAAGGQQPNAWVEHRGAVAQDSGKALASLLVGISSFIMTGIIGAIIAIVLGSMARKEIAASNGALKGKGMADWGFWLGWANVILTVIALLIFALVFVAALSVGTES